MLITNANFFLGVEGGGGRCARGMVAMNSVSWDVLLCDLVEMYQYFVGTTVLVFILEGSLILRNVNKNYILYLQE